VCVCGLRVCSPGLSVCVWNTCLYVCGVRVERVWNVCLYVFVLNMHVCVSVSNVCVCVESVFVGVCMCVACVCVCVMLFI